MSASLFEGELVRLTEFDPEKDAETVSAWTHDAEYSRLLTWDAVRPLSPAQVKKKYEVLEKESGHTRDHFNFAIRTRAEERLVGLVTLRWIEWNHGAAYVVIGIGSPEDRGRGYGRDAMWLILRYAFAELNLHRISAVLAEYNTRAWRFFQHAGFVEETRRREAMNRGGRRWDVVSLGLLRKEWEAATSPAPERENSVNV